MAQRLTLTAALLLIMVCGATCFFAWQSLQQGREVNLAVLARLEALATAIPTATSNDWTRLTIRCVREQPGGAPAVGFAVVLKGSAVRPEEPLRLLRTTDDAGSVVFDTIRTGRYELEVLSPWELAHRRAFVALPGRENVVEAICPEPPAKASVRLATNWPDDLRDAPIEIEYVFAVSSLECDWTKVAGQMWKWGDVEYSQGDEWCTMRSLRPESVCVRMERSGKVTLKADNRRGDVDSYRGEVDNVEGDFHLVAPDDGTSAELCLLPGSYECNEVRVVRARDAGTKDEEEIFASHDFSRATVLPNEEAGETIEGERGTPIDPRVAQLEWFEAHANRDNVWQIDVPDALWQQARARLGARRNLEPAPRFETSEYRDGVNATAP